MQKFFSKNFEMLSLDEKNAGYFSGYASVFNTVDSQGDIILPGAFAQTLQNQKKVKLLWQHDPKEPIGYFTNITETVHGLFVEGQIMLDVARGREVHALVKSGTIDGLSIGFEVVDCFYGGDVRYVKIAKLWEISVVTFPANEGARVKDIKKHGELAELIGLMDKLVKALTLNRTLCRKVLKD